MMLGVFWFLAYKMNNQDTKMNDSIYRIVKLKLPIYYQVNVLFPHRNKKRIEAGTEKFYWGLLSPL